MKKRSVIIIPVMLLCMSVLSSCGGSSTSSGSSYDADSVVTSESAMADSYGMAEKNFSADVYDDMEYEEAMPEEPVSGAEDVEVKESAASDRKLIRTVYLNVETYDFDELTTLIASKVSALGGYIENSSVDGNISSSSRSADYTLRIPKANADSFITSIDDQSNVTHRSENMEDVTLQYVDIRSRKESLQTEYRRLEELLAQAEDVEELIYIESRMSEVRYEIESIESQLRTYDNQVDYTTIHLTVYEVMEYTEPEPVDDSVGARISRGYKKAFENISTFLQDLLVAIAVAIPYLIIIAILILIMAAIIMIIVKLSEKIKNNPKRLEKKAQKAYKKQMAVRASYNRAAQATPGQTEYTGGHTQGGYSDQTVTADTDQKKEADNG